jgi:hypothetical protein
MNHIVAKRHPHRDDPRQSANLYLHLLHPLPRCRRSQHWMRDRNTLFTCCQIRGNLAKHVYAVGVSDIAEEAEQIVRANGLENAIM